MSGDGTPVRSHASQGEERGVTLQQRLIQAMERRAANLQGAARQEVLGRLSQLAIDPVKPVTADRNDVPPSSPQDTLRALLDHIGQRSASLDDMDDVQRSTLQPQLPPVAALTEARQLWSSLRAESQAREALAAEPTDAGPLNSAQLVHRALKLMRESSPDYLRHFLAYVDALSWLAEIAPEPVKASTTPISRARTRSKPKAPRSRQ